MHVTYAYPLVPVANILCSGLVLIPLPWLLQHWNTGAWTHALWSSLLCLITGVDTIIWADNVTITAVVWCDITVRITHAASLAIVTTNFVMARRLCLIMYIQNPMSELQKRKAKLFDLFVSIGIPVLSVALSWFIQGHRFTIIEGTGCVFAYYGTPLFVALYEGWFPVFDILAAIYGCFIFWALIRRRNALRDVVSVDPDISFEQFRRVIALGCTECLFTLPCTIYIFVSNVDSGFSPWTDLRVEHWGFSAIRHVPASTLDRENIILVQWNNWVSVFVALVFFLFFGLSRAMWVAYWKGFVSFAGRLGFTWPSEITRARTVKERRDFTPPIVFNIRSTLQSSSRATDASRVGGSETNIQPEGRSESSVCEGEQCDLEEGIVRVTEAPHVGNP